MKADVKVAQDGYRDFVGPDALEDAAWSYLTKGAEVGLWHSDGTEGAGIRSYAAANKDFPHEATADQWFTESQFESYRSLGLDIANDILGRDIVLCAEPRLTLRDAMRALKVQAPA